MLNFDREPIVRVSRNPDDIYTGSFILGFCAGVGFSVGVSLFYFIIWVST